MSFQISITPSRRAAGRFIGDVRDRLLKALADKRRASGLKQSDIAKIIGVHRSVINRELRGHKDITLGRIAELAYAMGLEPRFELAEPQKAQGVTVFIGQSSGLPRSIEMAPPIVIPMPLNHGSRQLVDTP